MARLPYPFFDRLRGFKHDTDAIGGPTQREPMAGHPTAPGFNEPYVAQHGAPSPGNGTPGVPRVQPRPGSKGPGIPGMTPSGPTQPGVHYEGEDEIV